MKEQTVGKRGDAVAEIPYTSRSLPASAKLPLHRRRPVGPPRQNVSFSGRGFMPDYMSEHGWTMLPEASRTHLENEGVYGTEGMMPPAGQLPPMQSGQATDGGAGGAGSFATRVALGAKG